MIKTFASACALSAAVLATTAHAGPFDIPVSERETYVDLGAAYVVRDAYVGSGEERANIFPYVAGEYEGRLFFNPAQGAGVNLVNDGTFTFAALASFASGRDADETPFVLDEDTPTLVPRNPAVEELFDIDSSVTAGVLGSVLLKYARLDVQVMTPVTGDVEGLRADTTLTTRLPIGPFFLAPGVRATWLSDQWTETYYGISPAQAQLFGAGSPLAAGYDPDSSWTLGAHAIATWEVVDTVQLVGAVNYSLLQGDAKDSPLAVQDDGLTAVLGIAKRF